ncbi:molybdopterin synthase sulfur carrier subunit [Candidatus Thorarchaeota archaeon]|nr:MAG: molybdopterin synthase sulfur carrier subunit [Candidatus Thorarchaeota archaeon]
MKISVRFRGPIAREIEGGIIEVELEEGLTLEDLFIKMVQHDSYLQRIWKEPAQIDRDSMILCNEVDIGITGGLETTLQDGDILTILPLVHGG